MKCFISFMLIITLTCVGFIACSNDTGNNTQVTNPDVVSSTETTAEITEETNYKGPEYEDYEGFKLRVATSNWINCDKMICPEELDGDIINDLVYNNVLELEAGFNADIELVLLRDFPVVTC